MGGSGAGMEDRERDTVSTRLGNGSIAIESHILP